MNQGPLDLQSNALPLSYTPTPVERLEILLWILAHCYTEVVNKSKEEGMKGDRGPSGTRKVPESREPRESCTAEARAEKNKLGLRGPEYRREERVPPYKSGKGYEGEGRLAEGRGKGVPVLSVGSDRRVQRKVPESGESDRAFRRF